MDVVKEGTHGAGVKEIAMVEDALARGPVCKGHPGLLL